MKRGTSFPVKSLLVLSAVVTLGGVLAGAMATPEAAPERIARLSDGRQLALPEADPAIPSPASFLGRPVGAAFTSHERILDYLNALAAASDRVRLLDYGSTYEGRPLRLVVISSAANLQRLEALRTARLRLDDPGLSAAARDRLAAELPLAVWLAYGVHGNESSSAEAAMVVAHTLAADRGELAAALESTIVLLDPLANPDGRERYLAAYLARRGDAPNPDPQSAEHREPWPGGRENHYYMDLNRDWAWATQRETRARLAVYRAWEPQVYVDLHEMSADSLTYFFPPSAEPINPLITPRVVSWLRAFGRANAGVFDRQGWTYFAHETYDLFYPGYGDSYPSLRGAVGMTYEVSGGGRAGELVRLPDGSLMSLADRVARHTAASLATVRVAAENRTRLLADFADQDRDAGDSPRTYLWRADQPEAAALAELLQLHGVRVEELAQPFDRGLRPLMGGDEGRLELPAGTLAVSTAQPLGNLVRALLNAQVPMSEAFVRAQRQRVEENRPAEFYDVTAWSLPLAFNLEMWVADGVPAALRAVTARISSGVRGSGEVGYLVPPQGLSSYRAAARWLRQGTTCRVALQPFRNGGADYPAGTLFLPRHPSHAELDAQVEAVATELQLRVDRVATSYSEQGSSLGSESVVGLRLPQIAMLRGDGVSPSSFGALWHLLDQGVELEPIPIEARVLVDGDLSRYDTLVLPDGDYDGLASDRLDAVAAANVRSFVESGGVLVAIGGAVGWTKKHELSTAKFWEPPKPDDDDDEHPQSLEAAVADRPLDTPGAVLATELRRSHPLAAGLRSAPPVLFSGSDLLLPTGDPRKDILVARRENPVLAGLAWPEARERLASSLLVAAEERGKGEVIIFAQDPAFRLFWRGTMPLFLNAVLYEPNRYGKGR